MKTIPFVPFPVKTAVQMSRSFLPFAIRLLKLFPDLEMWLSQSDTPIKDREYMSIALFSFSFWFLMMFSIMFPVFMKFGIPVLAIALSVVAAMAAFMNIVYYPKLAVVRRVRDIERNLFFALRHVIVHIKSGVSLFDAIESIASADYGKLSEEFTRVAKAVSSGTSLTDALEDMIYRNPSTLLRRSLWQIINSIKAGVDIGDSLSSMLKSLAENQIVDIKKYGSQLNPLALMYMMFAVIIPTLGLTFLVVFSMFTGITLQQSFFYLFLILSVVFQFSFIGIIKSKRPSTEL
ncbi:MAG TPA: type II secretion system F family protein [archaeon]|nr:type II secretion system F family protein [archaeon]